MESERNNQVVEMDTGVVTAVENLEAVITRIYANGNHPCYCFIVDAPEHTKLWVSDELDKDVINRLGVGSRILYSAELDDEGDMVMTYLKVM